MKTSKKNLLAIVVPLMGWTLLSCGNESANSPDANANATDYSIETHWLSLPVSQKAVDVFYLYPSAYVKTAESDSNICAIDNPVMLQQSASAFSRQATAFDSVANVYAPYYRQVDPYYAFGLSSDERDNVLGGIPTEDAIAAFDYFIKNFNKGRPFILVSHSQGAYVMLHLLSGYLKDNPVVYNRMIAAYVIGTPVTAQYMADNPHLKFAQGPDDVGVIISFNCQAPDVAPGVNPILFGQVGLVINPISWTRSDSVATTAEGQGSFMLNPATFQFARVPQYADAKVDSVNGVLICSTADENGLYELTHHAFPQGVYHSFEFPFYYYNIRANAANRVSKYLGQ